MTGLPTVYQNIISLSRYSRFLPERQRREIWGETVDRFINYITKKVAENTVITTEITQKLQEIKQAVLNLEVMPSMRLLMTAGEACERDNVAAFNCSFEEMNGSRDSLYVLTPEMIKAGLEQPVRIYISKPICFDEGMYVLLCGTGLGFSCERQIIASLPIVGHKLGRGMYKPTEENYPGVPATELSEYDENTNKIIVADSKYGWASALRILITELYNGNFNVTWDLSKIRPAGTPLKTFGGRASGPGPLNTLFTYCVEVFKQASGRKLNSIEVHGLICKIAEVVVVGGVVS